MPSATDKLQKTYSSFADSLTDETLEKFLNNTDAVMARPAQAILERAGIDASTREPFKLLDTACGTGPVGSELQKTVDRAVLEKSSILCGDVNQGFLEICEKRKARDGWINTKIATVDAQDSKLPENSFTHVTVGHGMHVIPDPDLVLKDTFRVLQPGGIFSFSTMHTNNTAWVPDVRSAFATLPFETNLPDPLPMTSNGKPEWADPEGTRKQLLEHGFEDVRVDILDHVQHVESAEHFVEIFSMMINWQVGLRWTSEQKEKYQDSLNERVVQHLREKHGGKGWNLQWTMIVSSCRKPMA